MFDFLKKGSGKEKLLLTGRGFTGTIFLLSFLSNIKNSVVAWKCPHHSTYFPNGITIFGKNDDQQACYVADEDETKELLLADIFSRMLNNYPSNILYCIGHWYNLHDVATQYGYKYFKKNNIKLINLIRHPVDRTNSHWHNLRTAFSQGMPEEHRQGFIGTINSQRTWLYDFLKEHNISLQNTEDATFIVSCLNLFACALDASYKRYQHINIESLNNEALIFLIKNISAGKIILEEREIEKFNTSRNSHFAHFYEQSQETKRQDYSMTAYEKFLSWSSWQQQLYKLCIQKSKLNKYYKKYQYELYV